MNHFALLLDELHAAQARRDAPRRNVAPARSAPILPTRPDQALRKAFEDLASLEGRSAGQAAALQQASLDGRMNDIRTRAKAAIEKAMAEIRELIAVGGITTQEVAERQILLDAFARRMGL
jgi:hypothetical protein